MQRVPFGRPGSLACDEKVNVAASIPFILMHVAPLGALVTGARAIDFAACAALAFVQMFGITAGYHRYFAHRSYRTSRPFQLVLALLGTASAQKGVLWWAGHHRHHHARSDGPDDIHSPLRRGFWWSHWGWILCDRYVETPIETIRDFARYPELRWLDRHYLAPPTLVAVVMLVTLGPSGLFVGFFLATLVTYHATFTINSLCHIFGSQRYETGDTSRNNFWLALITLGEGWHNNHHYYQRSTCQGFYWWELDITYQVLRGLAAMGVVWDLRRPPAHVLQANRVDRGTRGTRPDAGPDGRLLHATRRGRV